MPTLEEVYQKFGFASEAAQLLETELGTMLFMAGAIDAGLLDNPDPKRAGELLAFVDKQTLGQLLKSLDRSTEYLKELETLLARALSERNRLAHSFYREHNFRRNSDEGRTLMMKDLESIHEKLLDAYKAVLRVTSGVDLDKPVSGALRTRHVPI